MANQSSKTEFQFVNSTPKTPGVPQDLAIRALIRKQAMKKASAARRRDGNYGKHNLRQYPVFLFDQENLSEKTPAEARRIRAEYGYSVQRAICAVEPDGYIKDEETQPAKHHKAPKSAAERQRWLARLALTESLPTSLSAKGYELTSMKSGFDILDLSTLATLHVNRAGRAALSRSPYHLIHQLRSNKQWSYLSFLPSLYGHIQCLSDAADCVIARARQIISPHENWEAAVISFYVKALDSLQKALDCPKQRYKPEVLCATEILALYELLDPSGETAWIRHAAGAARLIQLRGPKNYNTEFEKALFMAHTGPIMTECLLNNERCFLEQKPWKAVMRSVIEESPTITDRSEIVVELLCLKANIPGFCVDITNIICGPGRDLGHINKIAIRLRHQRAGLLKWHCSYESVLNWVPHICPGSPQYDGHCKVFATYLSSIIISTRLLAAISPSERPELEEETQGYANQMEDLELEVKSASAQTALFMAQTLGVAQAAKATAQDWRDTGAASPSSSTTLSISPSTLSSTTLNSEGRDEQGDGSGLGLIEVWKFERWNKIMGRKLP